MNRQLKIARISTVPFFLDYQLKQQINDLLDYGFDVTAISSPDGDWSGLKNVEGLKCIPLDIARQPAPLKDLVSLYRLYCFFKTYKFDVVHSTTPKAGLLCAIAARIAGVSVRIHTFTGQTWATKTGLSKIFLCFMDKCIVWLNVQCYADSESQRDYLNSFGVGNNRSIKVLGKGSLAGVYLKRFNPDKWNAYKQTLLNDLGLLSNDFVIVFVGRLSREKGVFELIEAVNQLKQIHNNLQLILIGRCEELELEQYLKQCAGLNYIKYIGETSTPEKYLSISNLLCLPSYREGFGTVVIEAAAMSVPTVGTKITGLVDAIEDGVTGLLVEPDNVSELKAGLNTLIINREMVIEMGKQASVRCRMFFDSEKISELMVSEYLFLADEEKGNGNG